MAGALTVAVVGLPFAQQRPTLLVAADGGHADDDFMALYRQLRQSLTRDSNRDRDEVTSR